MRLSTTVQGHRLQLTHHCVERYCERVRHILRPNTVDLDRYSHELCHLLRLHGGASLAVPGWVITQPDRDYPNAPDLWITLGDDLAFPAVRNRREFTLPTTLTRGNFTTGRRAGRNRIRKEQRASERNRRQYEAWRGERNPRWN